MASPEECKLTAVNDEGGMDHIQGVNSSVKRSLGGLRYFILISTLICLSSIMANIMTFNFTVLCMNHQRNEHPLQINETTVNAIQGGYTKQEKTILFSSVAIGALLAVIPVTQGMQYYGARVVFFVCGMITALATVMVPFAAVQHSIVYFAFLRICQGVSFAACMPTTGVVTSNWASLKQHGLFISSLTSFSQLAGVFTMASSGLLCTSKLGWPVVYYLHGLISFISFTIWVLLYRNEPVNHPLLNIVELRKINSGKTTVDSNETAMKREKIPYLAILATPAIWGVWAAAIGDLLALQVIQLFSPQYIKEILEYSLENTGFSAACPLLFQFLVKVLAGYSSDKLKCFSETVKICLYNSIALGLSAVFMVALAFLPRGKALMGVILLTLATAMYGFNGGGFNKCATLVSRQYSQFVLGHIQILWCAAMLFCPILVSALLGEGTIYDWRLIFLLHAGMSFVGNAIFCYWATSDAAWWTDTECLEQRKKTGGRFWWWWKQPKRQ